VGPWVPKNAPRGPPSAPASAAAHEAFRNGELAQYVNDRPYAAASMLAVAIKEAFRTAPRKYEVPGPLALERALTHRLEIMTTWSIGEAASQVTEL